MHGRRIGLVGIAVAAFLFLGQEVAAQNGTLTGRVTDVESGQPLPAAQVQVLGGGQDAGALTDNSGVFRISLPAGSYSIVVTSVGHQSSRFDGIAVRAGETTSYDIQLASRAFELNPIIVSASRGTPEKSTEAPATTHSVSALEISERPETRTVDYLREAPGVDIVTHGVQASNVVVRGFNNIFSGALHMLTDHRLAGVPSLRVNLMHFIPSNQEDIERIEVVLGPGSALYGPNTANGVVHILTKSPLNSQGTTISLGGGERSVFQGSFRSAFLLGDDFGFKISGQYLQGDEWEFNDPTEEENRKFADANPEVCIADRMLRPGITQSEAQEACDKTGIRLYDIERYGVEARADWRFTDNGTFVATYGRNNSSGVELTGLGAGQTIDWVYEFYQARMNIDRFFVQAYLNTSNAGESYLLNTGVPLVDKSKLQVAQVQHGFDIADGRQDFTYGFDYIGTRPETENQINGVYEPNDNMDEWGVYLQSKTALSEKVDFIVAGRFDHHSVLDDYVFSPRAALVIKPTEEQSFRFSYNRAYSAPSSLNYFLDISNGFAPGLSALGIGLRAFGTGTEGWSLHAADGSLHGFRSPFNPAQLGGPGQMLPMGAATAFWQAAVGVGGAGLAQAVAAGAIPAEILATLPALAALTPTPLDIGTMIFDISVPNAVPIPAEQANLAAVPSVQESNTETFEFGWTGIINNRLKITGDLYYTKKNNFVSPLLVQNPLVTLNGADIGAFIQTSVVTSLTQLGIAQGLDPATAFAQAMAKAPTYIPIIAGALAGAPVGVVSAPNFPGGADIIVTYRNVGDLTLWGGDLAFQWFLNDSFTLNGTYSYVSDDLFAIDDGSDIALNSPKHKGSVSLAYRGLYSGFSAQGRLRFNNEFPAISAGFNGVVPSSQVVDMSVGYRVPNTAATLQLSVSNIFDSDYQSFVGVPNIGRMTLVRVKYDLF